MCGIFGFTFNKAALVETGSIRSLLIDLIKLSESRGKEASGLTVCNSHKLAVLKGAGSGSRLVKTNDFKRLAKETLSKEALKQSYIGCMGHTRLVTNGSMEKPENNQPVIYRGIIGIHNGIIVNDNTIFKQNNLPRSCEVDTEALLALVDLNCQKGKSIPAALGQSFSEIYGTASVALLFQDAPVMALATNNGSLYLAEHNQGIIFASERYILEKIAAKYSSDFKISKDNIAHILPGGGYLFDFIKEEGGNFQLNNTADFSDIKRTGVSLPLVEYKPPAKNKPRPLKNVFTSGILSELNQIHRENSTKIAKLKRCTKCILPETMPFISFDEKGVCNYCRHYCKQKPAGEELLQKQIETIKSNLNKPNCLFPLSGGRDSSYGLHYVKNVLKLNPIAYSYDWGMLTDLGRRNQSRMCGKLGVEHLLISADIEKKRRFIRQNVLGWLKKPDLGTVPLFMAGDKQYFFYLNRLKKQIGTNLTVYCENPLEQTNFKFGFCGVAPKFSHEHVYKIGLVKKLGLAFYYAKHYVRNPRLLNTSLLDTLGAFYSTYFMPHNYIYLYHYIRWNEEAINNTLQNEYGWEIAPDTTTTWRIGDGTAPFYNYIYFTVAGFTENDTFRSNQIREGILNRDLALELVAIENRPRWPALEWYGDTIGVDIIKALEVINKMPKKY